MKKEITGFFIFSAITMTSQATTFTSVEQPINEAQACLLPPKIDGRISLKPNCTYIGSLIVDGPVSSLDCRNSKILGNKDLTYGITVNIDSQTKNIEIKNCNIEKFPKSGILIKSTNSSEAHVEENTFPIVTVKDSTIRFNGDVGVFLGKGVSNVLVKNNEILGNRGPGIYLEYESKNNTILENKIYNNGLDPKGRNEWPYIREGMSIDSSAYNLIKGNMFSKNGYGAIFLYKNCGERNGPARIQPSQQNLIISNKIENEINGIWVAQRQSQDLSKMRCSDEYYAENKYALDKAPNNKIIKNLIAATINPIIVEDDDNEVAENEIFSTGKFCIKVGAIYRYTYLNHPVQNTIITANKCTLENNLQENNGFLLEKSSSSTIINE